MRSKKLDRLLIAVCIILLILITWVLVSDADLRKEVFKIILNNQVII